MMQFFQSLRIKLSGSYEQLFVVHSFETILDLGVILYVAIFVKKSRSFKFFSLKFKISA